MLSGMTLAWGQRGFQPDGERQSKLQGLEVKVKHDTDKEGNHHQHSRG